MGKKNLAKLKRNYFFQNHIAQSYLPPTYSEVDQIWMKLDENEVKLNLNDR